MGLRNPEYEVYFRKSYPTKEKDSQGYAGFGNQGEAFNKNQLRYFAEKLTKNESLLSTF
jgi:hypothetical protein